VVSAAATAAPRQSFLGAGEGFAFLRFVTRDR